MIAETRAGAIGLREQVLAETHAIEEIVVEGVLVPHRDRRAIRFDAARVLATRRAAR